MPKFEKLEFYYSSKTKPDPRYPCDIQKALKALDRLAELGLDARAIDVEELRDVFRAYHKAVSGPAPEQKSVLSEIKGASYDQFFGKTIPALLCYAKANDRAPSQVFPRKEGERLVTVNEALERILEEQEGN